MVYMAAGAWQCAWQQVPDSVTCMAAGAGGGSCALHSTTLFSATCTTSSCPCWWLAVNSPPCRQLHCQQPVLLAGCCVSTAIPPCRHQASCAELELRHLGHHDVPDLLFEQLHAAGDGGPPEGAQTSHPQVTQPLTILQVFMGQIGLLQHGVTGAEPKGATWKTAACCLVDIYIAQSSQVLKNS